MNFEETIVGKLTEVYQTVHLKEFTDYDAQLFVQPIPMEIPVDRDSSAVSCAADLTGRSATPWFSYKLLHHIV